MNVMIRNEATAWAPASVSNLGPGFDALGAAIDGLGDQVTVRTSEQPGLRIAYDSRSVWVGPNEPASNTAAVAAKHVARQHGYDGGLDITLLKGLPAGTGLGSSAASSVAAAVATDRLFESPIPVSGMIDAVIAGESATSGHGHADNVLPGLLGGFVLMRSREPMDHIRLEGWDDLLFIVALPDMEVMTKEARAALPTEVALQTAVDHAARLGLLVDAMHRRDVAAIGKWMMSDDIVVPARRHLWPCLEPVSRAAMEAGAEGCTVTGSGPAILACCRATGPVDRISAAMREASGSSSCGGKLSHHRIDNDGARLIENGSATSWRTGTQVEMPILPN